MIRLRIRTAGAQDLERTFEEPIIGVGRGQDNLLALPDKRTSRNHCRIEKDGDRYKVVDVASANGTMVNGEIVNFRHLQVGDVISLGNTRLEVLEVALGRPSRQARAVTRVPVEEGDGERQVRRYHRRREGNLSAMVILLAVIGALGVMAWLLNEQVTTRLQREELEGARRLAAEGQYDLALERLEHIPRDSTLRQKADRLAEEIRRDRALQEQKTLEILAARDYERLEQWFRHPDETRASMEERIDRFLKNYGSTSLASRAQALRGKLDQMAQAVREGQGTQVEESPLDKALREAEALVSGQRYQDAIEVLESYYYDHAGTEAEQVTGRIEEIRQEAAKAWDDIEFAVGEMVRKGEKDRARELLWKAFGFGIPAIQEAAEKLADEIGD